MAPPAGDSSRPEHVGRALSGYGSGAVTALATALLSASAYQLRLLVAAWRYRRSPAPPVCDSRDPRLVVLIPAHDEAGQIASAVRSVHAASYPAERREIVVVADNCSDATADIAEREGATVLERRDAELRGKGQALAWALGRLRNRAFDAIVLMDADCRASANLLQVVAGRLSSGSRAVQVEYTVANPTASGAAALRYAAFALAVSTRPLGRSALGASAGILGTGIALRRDLLERVRWDAFSLAEDLEYHARLVQAGERVEFAPEAAVTSPMPTTLADGATQQSRWESGRRSVARRYAVALLLTGLARRDSNRLHAALELLLPPQSLLLAGNGAVLLAALALRNRPAKILALSSSVAQCVTVVGALRRAGAPIAVYRSLVHAPALAARNLRIHGSILAGGRPRTWERATRERN